MKKALALLLTAVMAASMLAGCGGAAAPAAAPAQQAASGGDEVYNIKFECVLNETSFWYQMGQRMSEQLKEKTNGRINLECFANAQLAGGNQQKGMENVINNVVQIDCRSSMLWQVMDDKLGIWCIPFFYETTDQLLSDEMRASDGYKAYKETMEGLGLHLAGLVEYGPRCIASNVPIETYEDFAGKKIRVASVELHLSALQAFGANPMAMNWSEMYTGLQQGTVDGMEAPFQVMIDNTVNDVCKYYYDCNWVVDPGVVTVNGDFYNSLPDDLRQIFDEVFEECRAWEIEQFQAANETARDRLVSEFGCTVTPMKDEDLPKFKAAMEGVVASYEQKVGKEYLDLFR